MTASRPTSPLLGRILNDGKGDEDQFPLRRLTAPLCDQKADRRCDPRQWARRAESGRAAVFAIALAAR
jgi:hypothetical protein